jgi:hypothetical protein
MRIRSRRGRSAAAIVAVAGLLLAACVPPKQPPGPAGALRIVTPADGTQLGATGTVSVRIEVDPPLQPATLRVQLHNREHGPTDVTSRFVTVGGTATAVLTAQDVREGYSRIVATARTGESKSGKGATATATAAVSWEPRITVDTARGCDFIASARCLLPFPNDYFTRTDATSGTGRRVAFQRAAMPANSAGVHVDPAEWNRNDGFSPGSAPLLHVPGVDLVQTGAPPITDLEQSLDADSPTVLVDAAGGGRTLHWAELDANASTDAARALMLVPGVTLEDGHRYVVALRRLRDVNGALIEPTRAFEVYRDGIPTFIPAVEARRAHMESLFTTLAGTGVGRSDLYVAWDFTVASTRNLTERLLHIRDDAFASLGGAAPQFTVTGVQENDPNLPAEIFRRVSGTFTVPKYLTGTGAPGSRFGYGGDTGVDALPVRDGVVSAPFVCNISRATTADGNDPVTPARGVVYGHGLLGSLNETNSSAQRAMANEHNMVYCGTNWAGMANEDIGNVATIIGDFSNFPTMADRLQQGILNTLFLGRLLKDPNGFAAHAAFRAGASSTPVLRPGEVFYDGNSQGGILGGAATAVSTEWTRAVLGVPGLNYSLLLRRSVDFDPFAVFLDASYPDELDQALLLQVIQMLWDRGEANGYANHMTADPLPGTPPHEVLLHEAFGDHQVANVSTEIEARTIGARLVTPALAPGRHTDVDPFFGIDPVPGYPFGGSALVVWDSGTPAPPTENVPPRAGSDPHGRPRAQVSARVQKSEFLRDGGGLIDVCGGAPCLAP